MADEIPNTAPLVAVQTPLHVPPEEVPVEETSAPPPHGATVESVSVTEKQVPLTLQEAVPPVKPSEEVIQPEKPVESKKVPASLVSFKEESNKLADLLDSERRSLDELKQLLQKAIDGNEFSQLHTPVPTEATSGTENPKLKQQILASETDKITAEPSIWGIPLLTDERSDVILLKFLRARDFKVKDAFTMLKNTIKWRKDFGIDDLIDEDLGDDLEKVVFMHGFDKEGHPVCYNVYGEFQNKELYQKTFADEEKRTKFLRWRIQFLEKSIRKLDFSPGGICTIFQVSDLKNSPGPGKGELRLATKQALQLLQDNYPEFVTKQVFINVPWWYLAFYTMISPFLTQRTKSKFVFASPAKTPETLFKYIAPQQVPIIYGGLSVDFCECNPEFTMDDPASEITIKPATKQTVEILVYEKCIMLWELRVVGWEVSYSAEYVPNDGGYAVIIHKAKKMTPTDEPVVSNSFKISELGKILLTIDNPTSKKKKLLYRFKVKPYCD